MQAVLAFGNRLKSRGGWTARLVEGPVVVFLLIVAALALLVPGQAVESLRFTADALLFIAPFILISVLAAAYAKATGLDRQLASVFGARPLTAVVLAALFGAFSPFCSCGVVPIVAGLLGAGVPLGPVMAFWIASPLMDPEMFVLMLPVFGVEFSLMKTGAAVSMGLVAGFATHALASTGALDDMLKPAAGGGCGTAKCGGPKLEDRPLVWRFWGEGERRETFRGEAGRTAWFLGKWLTLAFLLESLMLAYLPADMVGRAVGGDSWWAVPAAVAVGIPAYLNGYAAIPTVDALIGMGMAPGAGLAFMLAGGVTSIPAAMAVWALVRGRVFWLYVGFGLIGALAAGIVGLALL